MRTFFRIPIIREFAGLTSRFFSAALMRRWTRARTDRHRSVRAMRRSNADPRLCLMSRVICADEESGHDFSGLLPAPGGLPSPFGRSRASAMRAGDIFAAVRLWLLRAYRHKSALTGSPRDLYEIVR
jgi:hypothetical protein